jgi:dTDP-4-amino-4,6-dideoxygalactose transaminase
MGSPNRGLGLEISLSAATITVVKTLRETPSVGQHREPSKPLSATVREDARAVPMLDLARQYEQIRAEMLAAVGRVCESQQFILGPEVEALERELAEYCGARYAVGCASGTDALWLALVAAAVQPGDWVLTTPFSFFASSSAIVRAGARPVFADIDPLTFNLSPAAAEAVLTTKDRRLRAILPVHLFGQCADMDAFQALAGKFKLALIEDAAQAIGASFGANDGSDRRAGTMGTAAAFSFYPTKNLSAAGDAGLVTTNDERLAAQMRQLRNHGSPRRYVHDEFGWNCRLDAIQAAVLRVKLKRVDSWNQARRERAALYDRLFLESKLTGESSPIQLPQTSARAFHVFHQYVVRAERRDALREFLTARRIGSEVYYPIPLHLQSCFAYLGHREGDFPESERAAREVLALPMFPELTEDEQRRVVEAITEFYQ